MPIIGIDAGVHTGIAIIIRDKFVKVESMCFWDAINLIRDMREMGLKVYIEDPGKISAMYSRPGAEKYIANARSEQAYRSKMAQYVGSNKRDAQLIIQFCTRRGIPVFPVKPMKGALSKTNAETFKQYTRWEGRTDQHGRDAGMLIYGMKEAYAEHKQG